MVEDIKNITTKVDRVFVVT